MILPSITRRSLEYVAEHYLGMEVEERDIYLTELWQKEGFSSFYVSDTIKQKPDKITKQKPDKQKKKKERNSERNAAMQRESKRRSGN